MRKSPIPVLLEKLLRVEILARGLAARHQENVVACEGGGVRGSQDAVDDHGEGHAKVVYRRAEGDVLAALVDQDLGERGSGEVEAQDGGARDKGEEVAVVAAADTVVEPDAVVVLRFDTVVAETAVVGARGAPDVAGLAELGGHFHGGRVLFVRLD